MSNPAREQLEEVFASLVSNGLDFFMRSAHELEREQKFAVAHFATGLELILKARLFREHWTLIATEPHKCAWTSVKDGTVRTLQASDLCAAITTTTSTPLNRQSRAFKAIFDHRNRVLHWTPQNDLAETVAEQCVAWLHLRELLTSTWADTFAGFRSRIEEVERRLRDHRAYLEATFRQFESELKGPEHAGLVLLCPSCEFRAGVAEDGPGRVRTFECRVCGYEATALRADSGVLEHRERSAILDELDPTPLMSPKESSMYTPDRGCCGECFEGEETVTRDGDAYVCVACGVRFEPANNSTCECCNQRWFGWSSDSSYYTGCNNCDGCGGGRD